MEQEQPLKILILEDNADDVELIVHMLKKEKISFLHRHVETRDEFHRTIDAFTPDIVLSDHGLPSFNSLDALKICLRRKTSTPFILVAGALSDELVSCLRGGADDYVLKSNLSRLPNVIRKAAEKKRNEQHKGASEKWIKAIWKKIASWLIKPSSTYKVNQAVQHISGGPLMVVSGYILHRYNELHIICKWYDREQLVTLRQEFPERELKHFDWNNPNND